MQIDSFLNRDCVCKPDAMVKQHEEETLKEPDSKGKWATPDSVIINHYSYITVHYRVTTKSEQ